MGLLETVDSIAFLKMDERLLRYLKEKSQVNDSDIIHSKHKEIAHELYTSRVAVSRLLESLENKGKIEL